MKISIIVPIYNVEQYLNECIESIVNQSYKNIEIILSNDGSPDACPVICNEWASKDERIQVIHQENKGLSEARNAGIRRATGDYIAFIDSDDYYQDLKFVEKIYNILSVNDVDLIHYNTRENIQYTDEIKQTHDFKEGYIMLTDMAWFHVNAWTKVVRRDIIVGNALYFKKGIICEDFEWTYRLIFHVNTVQILSETPIFYRETPTSIMHNINCKMIKDMLASLKDRVAYIQQIEDEELFCKHLMYMMGKMYFNIIWKCSSLNNEEREFFCDELRELEWLVSYINPKSDGNRQRKYRILGMKWYMRLLVLKRKLRV